MLLPTGSCIVPTTQTLKVAVFFAIMMLPTLEANYGRRIMNIGNQIKALRLRRGVTQEELAQHFGITSQAVSKWECGSSVPDIGMLPGLSTYFGVSIDELFELSDEQRMERIQNMLYDVRFTNPADVENERRFLLEKARREPSNNEVYEMLANLELHIAGEHNERAEEYALQAMACAPLSSRAFTALAHAMGGKHVDPRNNAHNALISHYKLHLAEHPEAVHCYAWLIAQLIDDKRLDEAKYFCNIMAQYDSSYYVTIHLIKIALAENHIETARVMWEQLGKDYPKNWSVWHWIGDFQAQIGDYAAAKESYKISFDLMDAPHYTDPLDSLAKVCEMAGDIEDAIATRKYELEIGEREWNDTVGESVDVIHREIARLEKLL